ncbi:MAG: hypothetical protein GDA36_00255 [Rhodobacteraceae bacterium]|nr:hypothetical protein [Paracoccaceae bacterium]
MVPLDKTNALKPLKTQGLIKHMLRRRITHDQVAPSLSKGYLPVSNNASIISDAALIIALLLWANNYKRPLRDSVICGERADLAILSDPLALKRVKRFWWSGYAIAGVCGVRVILFAAPRRWPARNIERCFIVPKHCSIPQTAFGDQPAPAFISAQSKAGRRGRCG